jgi:hypothetical protein
MIGQTRLNYNSYVAFLTVFLTILTALTIFPFKKNPVFMKIMKKISIASFNILVSCIVIILAWNIIFGSSGEKKTESFRFPNNSSRAVNLSNVTNDYDNQDLRNILPTEVHKIEKEQQSFSNDYDHPDLDHIGTKTMEIKQSTLRQMNQIDIFQTKRKISFHQSWTILC